MGLDITCENGNRAGAGEVLLFLACMLRAMAYLLLTRPQNYKELFNLRHSQARNAIERIFGILKKRFPIAVQAPEFLLTMQSKLVLSCCVLHNFIRLNGGANDYFEQMVR